MIEVICFHNPDEINGFLSNWYPSKFTDENNINYTSMEQYMMYQKAILFKDEKIAGEIMNTENVGKIKSLGRQISNFDEKTWSENKFEIVSHGVYLKFTQNEDLKNKLLSYSSDCIFAECALRDSIWGIGMSMNNPDRFYPSRWNGENLLGKAIKKARDEIILNSDN